MMLTLIHTIMILTLLMIMLLLLMMVSKKSLIDSQKSSPFECGFNPLSNKRLPFSIHFFLIAIIFLIFDIEIVIILPAVSTMKFSMIKYWSITTFSFILILILGLYYEWFNGLLNWQK